MKSLLYISFILLLSSRALAADSDKVVFGLDADTYRFAIVSNKINQLFLDKYAPPLMVGGSQVPEPMRWRLISNTNEEWLVWFFWKEHLVRENCPNCGRPMPSILRKCPFDNGDKPVTDWSSNRVEQIKANINRPKFFLFVVPYGTNTVQYLRDKKGIEPR